MTVKKKPCDGTCNGEFRVIWKNSNGKRYCKSCWNAHSGIKPTLKQKKAIRARSPKRVLLDAEYSVKRKAFLEKNPMCKMRIPSICTQYATDVHHMNGRIGDLYLDETYWLPGCRTCHSWVELHPKEAREMGLSGTKH